MSKATYYYATSIAFGGDVQTGECDVEVSYEVAWGTPETGAGYLADPAKYDPGSASTVEAIKLLTVDGQARPWGMGLGNITDDEFERMVIERLDDQEEAMLAEAEDHEHQREWADSEDRDDY